MFTFGVEHEVAFLDRNGRFADFHTTTFAEFDAIIAELPFYKGDYPQLRIGDAGIRRKRWYIEGLERFDETGHLIDYHAKGIEIRTTPHSTIPGAIAELHESFQLLRKAANSAGFVAVLTSFNPYRTDFVPDPPLNPYEEMLLQQSPEDLTSLLAMLTYGPDLSISVQGLSSDSVIDIGRKFTYYSPYIVPFSYSSPFFEGALWEGLSVRTFKRTGVRPAVMVFLAHSSELQVSNPSLTKLACVPAEIGRIEFKACDSCDDFSIYAGLLALLKGLALDTTLSGRATVPDAALHRESALRGFAHEDIATGSLTLLQAAEKALGADEDSHLLAPLRSMLQQRETPAHRIIHTFHKTRSIEASLYLSYAYGG